MLRDRDVKVKGELFLRCITCKFPLDLLTVGKKEDRPEMGIYPIRFNASISISTPKKIVLTCFFPFGVGFRGNYKLAGDSIFSLSVVGFCGSYKIVSEFIKMLFLD